MVAAGLRVTINSDDPTMFHADIGKEYVDLCGAVGYGVDQVRTFVLDGVAPTWLDDTVRAAMRADFTTDLDELERALERPRATL
jgi:adenosine deaminase